MSMITVRGLDDETKRLLRQRAARHGRSMEGEARAILAQAVRTDNEPVGLVDAIRRHFADAPEHDLDLPDRSSQLQRPVEL